MQDRNKTYFLYNPDGKDSAAMRDKMMNMGFKEVYNVLGGLNAWKAAGYPTAKG